MFEIKFVQHQDPFYQLGKLYVYKLQVELFQYASEFIDTGVPEIDTFESLKTFSTNTTRNNYGELTRIQVYNYGSGYTTVPTVSLLSSSGHGATAEAVLGTGSNSDKVVDILITNSGTGYQVAPTIIIDGDGIDAAAQAFISMNIDKVESFADNNKFKTQSADILFSESNPFGDINPAVTVNPNVNATSVYSDSTTITADTV
jgi:hypothetical protein